MLTKICIGFIVVFSIFNFSCKTTQQANIDVAFKLIVGGPYDLSSRNCCSDGVNTLFRVFLDKEYLFDLKPSVDALCLDGNQFIKTCKEGSHRLRFELIQSPLPNAYYYIIISIGPGSANTIVNPDSGGLDGGGMRVYDSYEFSFSVREI